MEAVDNAPANPERTLRAFLVENFPLGGDIENLDPDVSLLEAGVIDSTGVLELIGFLEDTFGLSIPDEDLVPANFDSIANILGYVARRSPA
jgi:acyl carrier protein